MGKSTTIVGQAFIPADWTGEYCRYAVCWPNSPQWLAVLRGVLTLPGQGRFWNEQTGIITEAQEVILETFDNNLHLVEVIMACGDTGLAQIAMAIQALAAAQCCGQSVPESGGVVVNVEVGAPGVEVNVPIYGTGPGIELPAETVPESYPGTLEEYDADKCRTAAALVSAWIQGLRNLASLNFASSVGLTLVVIAAIPGLIVLPEFMIPILIAAAAGQVGINAGLTALADGLTDSYDDIVCALYNAGGTVAALSDVAAILQNVVVALGVTAITGAALRTIAMLLLNTDTVDRLFNMSQGIGEDHDCSGCLSCGEFWGFDSDLEGWTGLTTQCFGITSSASASVNASAGAMVMTAPNVGSLNRVTATSPALGLEVSATTALRLKYTVTTNNGYLNVNLVLASAGCVNAVAGNRVPDDYDETFDLSAYEGDVIESVELSFNNTINQQVNVSMDEVELVC